MLDVVGETLDGLVLKGAPKKNTLEASLDAYTKPNLIQLAEANDFEVKKSWNKNQMIEVISEGLRDSLEERFQSFEAEELTEIREMLDGKAEADDLHLEVVSDAVNKGLLYVASNEDEVQFTMPAEMEETLADVLAHNEPAETEVEAEAATEAVKPVVQPSPFRRSPQRVQPVQQRIVGKKVGRNEPCPCGSGKKYKKCCWSQDQRA